MRIFLLFSICFISPFGVIAQEKARVGFETTDRKLVLKPTVSLLTKETNYAVEMPSRLKYVTGEQNVRAQVWDPYQSVIQVGARVHTANPDLIFRFITSGMINIKEGGIRWHRDDYGGPRGFVKDISYSFPLKLEVFDVKRNKTIKSIVIVPETQVFSAVYQSAWATDGWAPYADQAVLINSFASGMDAFYKYHERKTALNAFWQGSMAVTLMYDDYNLGKTSFAYGYVKKKGRVHDYSDLDSLEVKYIAAVDLAALNKDNLEAAVPAFSALRNEYAKLLTVNDPRIDENVKNILHYNISWCALMMNDIEGAEAAYKQCLSTGMSAGSRPASELRNRIDFFSLRNRTRL